PQPAASVLPDEHGAIELGPSSVERPQRDRLAGDAYARVRRGVREILGRIGGARDAGAEPGAGLLDDQGQVDVSAVGRAAYRGEGGDLGYDGEIADVPLGAQGPRQQGRHRSGEGEMVDESVVTGGLGSPDRRDHPVLRAGNL